MCVCVRVAVVVSPSLSEELEGGRKPTAFRGEMSKSCRPKFSLLLVCVVQ